ncbi:hypothetical protein OESDEN_14649 [Oesophagostomum dentatum]|uniref:RNA helicase n=1 Tax=Oesophagostomum dentatum TaxID=61180 RepID=A0A0B1SR14_OESDE|nr:hypothetical protein OESDEN_14649 [Oesophagostomum dentatum]
MLAARPKFCNDVRHLVLDEADLLLSFGYEEEMNAIKKHLPASYQCILTSATITDDMSALKSLFMVGSVFTIKLKEGDLPDVDQLTQYQITCLDDNERFAILVAMFKLRTSLVLRAFGLKSCILNSSMPANSRFHVINQYNNGACDIVIASDASDAFGSDEVQPKESGRRDKEAGVSRGIDFHQVGKEVLSKCGKSVIKAARMQEIKLEIMRSAKLQSFFANNPREKTLMETTTRPTTVAVHTTAIADVPDYMG